MGIIPGHLPSGDPERREYRKEVRELLDVLWAIVRYPAFVHGAHLAILTRILTDPKASPREQVRAAAILASLQGRVLPKLADVLAAKEVVLDELGLPRSEGATPSQAPRLVINIGVPQVHQPTRAASVVDVELIAKQDEAPPADPPSLNRVNGDSGPHANGKAQPGGAPPEP